jgi:hypothetical protein
MVKNKILLLVTILVFILLPSKELFSAPCYGTHMPEKKKIVIGIQNHTVFKRYLEDDFGKLRSLQNFILLSYGLSDWFSLDLKGGAGYIKQHPLNNDELDYSTGFAGGYGFRIKFYDKEKTKMLFGFQHISVHPKSSSQDNQKNQAILDDWQGSLLVSYDFKRITPYLGTKLSRMDYIHKQDGVRKRKMSDLTKSLGLVLGMDFSIDKKSYLNVEVQLLDVEALAVSLNYNF